MKSRHLLPSIVLFVIALALACGPAADPAPVGPGPDLQKLLDTVVADFESIHAVALHVDAPGRGLTWEGAAGVADPATNSKMTPAHPVRIASNTKTYVAAAVLRLFEEGQLDLDDPISRRLPATYVELLKGDGYDTEAITIRQLLTHTSGMYDHSDSDNYLDAIMAAPDRKWTAEEQAKAAVEWGDPLDEPGVIYSYCDTGYVLLGQIVEQSTGDSLARAVRSLTRFEELGLNSTWWEDVEVRPPGVPERAHQFLGELDVFEFDPSIDLYGGGGLVSTVGDMARFMRGLFTGEVYRRPETAETMLTTLEGLKPHPEAGERALTPGMYRMGVWVAEVEGYTVYQHTGFWGTSAVFVPELDLAVALTVNQNQSGSVAESLLEQAIRIVLDSTD